MVRAGINLIYIRDFLGHADCSTAEIYARIDTELKRKATMETAMRYLDITTEQEAAALATLEEERHKDVKPKWNPEKDSLAAICNLRKITK